MRTTILTGILICTLSMMYATIHIDKEVLLEGKSVTISLDEPVDSVKITYRPNSQVSSTDYLTAATPTTTFEWTPASAGVVALQAGSASRTVSVRFAGISWSGILIMIVAGILLFGGAGYAFWLLMYGRSPGELDVDIEHRVDT